LRIDAVVKVGGSLLSGDPLPLLRALEELSAEKPILVVPGGGPFADAVRIATRLHDPGSSAAHWMAILGMNQHAHLLSGLLASSEVVEGREGIARALGEGRVPILAPFSWLKAEDTLPHGWHVTSDSIAAWVAVRLGASCLVLLKSIDGFRDSRGGLVAEAWVEDPGLRGVVDHYFPEALGSGPECWILNGRHPERLSRLLREGETLGTRLRARRGAPELVRR
jgi:aspartokinase-like uncharacterized kinase